MTSTRARSGSAVCVGCDGLVADADVVVVEGNTMCPDDAADARAEHVRSAGSWPVRS